MYQEIFITLPMGIITTDFGDIEQLFTEEFMNQDIM